MQAACQLTKGGARLGSQLLPPACGLQLHLFRCSLGCSPSAAEYAQVLRMLGNGRLEAHCMDGVKRLCHIRGKMRKKVRLPAGQPPTAVALFAGVGSTGQGLGCPAQSTASPGV